jgi:hypothetical protein
MNLPAMPQAAPAKVRAVYLATLVAAGFCGKKLNHYGNKNGESVVNNTSRC